MSFKNKEKETVSSKVLRQEAGVWGVVLWRKRATTAASGGNVGGTTVHHRHEASK